MLIFVAYTHHAHIVYNCSFCPKHPFHIYSECNEEKTFYCRTLLDYWLISGVGTRLCWGLKGWRGGAIEKITQKYKQKKENQAQGVGLKLWAKRRFIIGWTQHSLSSLGRWAQGGGTKEYSSVCFWEEL